MARPWYAFYPADYARDTGHLTLIEHGAYRVLMDHYYATAAPLPADRARLFRICGAHAPEEQAAVQFVLGAFFTGSESGFHHARIDAEIEKAAGMTARGAFAGRISAARRGDNANTAPTRVQPSQSQSPSQEKYESPDNGFELFWSAYPRREAKAVARLAYAKALEHADAQTLLTGARAYAARREGEDRKFTKLAATWLKQECWLDDRAAMPDAGALQNAWGGEAAPLIGEIGAEAFQAYFAGTRFSKGPPARIRIEKPYLRALIARKFSGALSRAFGEHVLEAAE